MSKKMHFSWINVQTSEMSVAFQVDGLITIPVEFAFSVDQTNVLTKFPKFSKTSAEAVTGLQKYVKRAVSKEH